MFFLLALAYRLFRNPFAAWTLVAMTIVVTATALVKLALGMGAPWLLGPNALKGAFQLSFFAFIPLSVYLALSEWRWRDLSGERHRVFFWPTGRAVLWLLSWLLLLFALFLFNLLLFPRG